MVHCKHDSSVREKERERERHSEGNIFVVRIFCCTTTYYATTIHA